MLVFREGVFSDSRWVDPAGLLDLNRLIEEVFTEIASQKSEGDC